jgi:acetyl esterase
VVKVVNFLAYAVLSLFGLAAIGLLVPAIPVLGELGPIGTSTYGLWITLISAVGAAWLFLRWRRNRRSRTVVVALLAALAALSFAYAQSKQIDVARANNIDIDPLQALFPASQSAPDPKPETIAYATYDGHRLPLDIYRSTSKGRRAPILVYIHGGGWGGQTLKQREADYRWFVARGYLVISLEYTLSTATRNTWNIVEPQLGCGLAWIGANATRYGGDASKLALWGESAGGNLVINISYRANAGTLKPSCPGSVPHIAATLAQYPVVDPARMYRPVDPLLGVFGRMMGDRYTGGSPEKYPDRYLAIASATHITAKAPPTLLVIPESDHLVDPKAAYAFEAKARAAGVRTRLIKMPFAEHAFDLGSGSIGNQLVRQSMLRFLDEQGMRP